VPSAAAMMVPAEGSSSMSPTALAGLMIQFERLLEEMGPKAARAIADAATRVASSPDHAIATSHQQHDTLATAVVAESMPHFAPRMLSGHNMVASSPCNAGTSPLPRSDSSSVAASTRDMLSTQQQQQQQQQEHITRVSPFAKSYPWLPTNQLADTLAQHSYNNSYSGSFAQVTAKGGPGYSTPAVSAGDGSCGAAATSALIASLMGSSCAADYSYTQALSSSSLDNSLQGLLLTQQLDQGYGFQAAPQSHGDFDPQVPSSDFGLLSASAPVFSAAPLTQLGFTGALQGQLGYSSARPSVGPRRTFSGSFTAHQVDSEPLWGHSPISLGPLASYTSPLPSMDNLALDLGSGPVQGPSTGLAAPAHVSGEGWASEGLHASLNSLVGNQGYEGPLLGYLL
jgi:hypothetical protein